MSVNYQVSVAFDCMMVCFTCNPGQKVWDTLGNVIQVNSLLSPAPARRTVLDAKKAKYLLHILHRVRTSTLIRGEMAKKPKFNIYIYRIQPTPHI